MVVAYASVKPLIMTNKKNLARIGRPVRLPYCIALSSDPFLSDLPPAARSVVAVMEVNHDTPGPFTLGTKIQESKTNSATQALSTGSGAILSDS